jgi:hypothetical protein
LDGEGISGRNPTRVMFRQAVMLAVMPDEIAIKGSKIDLEDLMRIYLLACLCGVLRALCHQMIFFATKCTKWIKYFWGQITH